MFLESSLNGGYPLPLIIIGAYFAGILASFTPCIYPMLPITMGIITAQKTASMLTNFLLSLSYGMGIAVVYSTLGYLSAKSNLMFGQWLANPWFIASMIALFVYLAFSMFGFYEMYTPSFLQPKPGSTSKKGSFFYSFMFGIITGAAASPCLTPALALLLGYAAKQSNPLVGIVVLFAFAMGLSTLLIVLGTFSSSMTLLPRAGTWMNEVKKVFGFLLLAVCVYYLQPLVCNITYPFLQGLLCLSTALYYATHLPRQKKMLFLYVPAISALSALGVIDMLQAYHAYLGN